MATQQSVLWTALLTAMPRDTWIPLQDVYRIVEAQVSLQPDDSEPDTPGSSSLRWQRNVRNVLQARKGRDLYWSGDGRYFLPSERTMEPADVTAETNRRRLIWDQLSASNRPDEVSPDILREVGIYRGAQGVWVDKARTRPVTTDGNGVTVGLLHTGSKYPDDLSETALIYHYPITLRPPARDLAEINATKTAAKYTIPVFVITTSPSSPALRQVRLAWVQGWDDIAKQFLVTFSQQPPSALIDSPYGPHCALCDVGVREVLDAVHIRPLSNEGSDDPRNGLVLCAIHHRAFDADLFAFEPLTHRVLYRKQGPSALQLHICQEDLSHIERLPHPDAIAWRWAAWKRDTQS